MASASIVMARDRKKKAAQADFEAKEASELDAFFTKHDADSNGTLDRAELLSLLQALEPEVTIDYEPVDMILAEARKAQGDEVTASGTQIPTAFMKVMVKKYRSWLKSRKALEELFAQADTDGSKSLQPAELTALLQKAAPAGYTVTADDSKSVMDKCDVDASGAIELSELSPAIATWMEMTKMISQKLTDDDAAAASKKSSACVLL